ncbi:DUF6070 family protein [Dorea longicatena]|uniref:DUF6070 family protein n=1 Tax=Dorea longicatena TaxID=88431 RepID=UPI0022E707B3|nr:DUF6070 family protein [Dorea longicatena]
MKNKKIFMGNYYICKIFAMILIVLIVFTGEKSELNTLKVKRKIINCLEEKGYAAVDCDNQIDMVNREKVEEFCKTAEKEEQAAVDIVQPNRDSLQY